MNDNTQTLSAPDYVKLPAITLMFWIMKICATTLGETGGDLLSMTMNIGYGLSSLILIGAFLLTLFIQLASHKFNPYLYWGVILTTSTAGTTMSDYMDRTLDLGYATGSTILAGLLVLILAGWKFSGLSMNVQHIKNVRHELLYWTAILISNTLGTALGDYLADDSGLGFAGGALLISGIIAAIAGARYVTKISPVILFWAAFVLTRPFGATAGDFMTKSTEDGGLGLGTIWTSAVLAGILVVLIIYSQFKPDTARDVPDDHP